MTQRSEMGEAEFRRLLPRREVEGLEFKGELLQRKEITDYAVGIGNAGGGWLILGVTNKPPRRITGIPEPSPEDLQKIRDSVLDAAGIVVELTPLRLREGVVLAVRIPSRPKGQLFYTRTGKYLIRIGEELRGMTLAEIERIRGEDLARPDFTAEPVHPDWNRVVDPIEVRRLREVLSENRREELAKLSDEDLLRSLGLLVRKDGKLQATRAAVLLLGTRESIQEFVPRYEVKLQRYGRDELTPTFSEDSASALLAVAQRAKEVIEAANTVEVFQSGLFRVEVPKFPERAYREAVANALIHRDYQVAGNVAVRIYANRLEIGSPGGWFGGVSEENILVTESHRRNELLASVLQRIGLAERSSLGVKRMFQALLEAGKPPPEFRSTTSSVTVTLRDGTFDKAFAALVQRASKEGVVLGVFELLLLSHLKHHREITIPEAATLCQQSAASSRRFLDELRNRKLLDRRGEGRGRKYVLGPLTYEWLNLTGERARDLGMSKKTIEGLLLEELERRKEKGVTTGEIREWSQSGRAQTTRLLQDLCRRGVIVSSGKRGRGARYWLRPYVPGSTTT